MPTGERLGATREFSHGDLIIVTWADITTDPVGEPEDASVTLFTTVGYFLSWRPPTDVLPRFLVITDSLSDEDEPYGTTAFPVGCIMKIEMG